MQINMGRPNYAMLHALAIKRVMPMKKSITAKSTTSNFGVRVLSCAIGMLTCFSVVEAAEPTTAEGTGALQHFTREIDVRMAFLVSLISIGLLVALWKADYKSPFGIWGGRFIIFMLVVSNIFLWSTQI